MGGPTLRSIPFGCSTIDILVSTARIPGLYQYTLVNMAWRGRTNSRGRGNAPGSSRSGQGIRGGRHGQSRGNSSDTQRLPATDEYFDLKRLLRRDSNVPDTHYITQSFRIWSSARSILDGDNRDIHQSVARDLTSDELEGHVIIVHTTSVCTRHTDDHAVLGVVEPFLQVLTHPALLDSISVDNFLGVIYRSFGGTNGDRGLAFFSSLCRRLISSASKSMDVPTQGREARVTILMLAALHQLLVREHRVRFNDDLPPVFTSIDALINIIAASDPATEFQSWRQQLDFAQRIVEIAKGRLDSPSQIDSVSALGRSTSTFPLAVEAPGGRHDNDHADITQIQTLPTLQEICYRETEYLPSTNLLHPHHLQDPVQRHIDSLFRLLRHDIFSDVKDVLGELVSQDSQQKSISLKDDTRAHIYSQATIQQIFIHERRGLQAILAFSAPTQIRKKSKAEQRRWWQETSRLEEGNLVCLIAVTGTQKMLLFLEVDTKRVEPVRKQDDHQDHINSCLVPDKGLPGIAVKLATRNESDLGLLIQLHGQGQQARGMLVEFHGLIPATFSPILKNLQRMMGEGHMTFEQWLVPGRLPQTDALHIPPPAYARKPEFTFRLDPIARDGPGRAHNLFLDPIESSNEDWDAEIQMLLQHTNLDRGQCIGLVAALRREYTLIQGPPGTGKSYLGVQLVRVLLENKIGARLGPLLVM